MIQLVRSNDQNIIPKFECKVGDKIRFPVDATMMFGRANYNFKFLKYKDADCFGEIESEEVNNGRLVPFKCSKRGSFKLRVKNYDSIGAKQFAINIQNKILGKTFKSKAGSLSEYISKIVKNFNKVKGWEVKSNGNILTFNQNDDCYECGSPINISIGDYNFTNQNNPSIESEFIETVSVIGKKCYLLRFKDFVPGNKFTINGITILVEDEDTEQTLQKKVQDDAEYFCIPNTDTLQISIDQGLKTVVNNNNPKLKAVYVETDANYDYYHVTSFDVRQGNIFDINGVRIIASQTDTQTTINAFFNAYSDRFRITKGTSINPVAISSSRLIANSNSPEVEGVLVSTVATKNMDKYLISIGSDVKKGNTFSLGGNYYVAKENDTNLEVAYGLYGSNSPSFFYYTEVGSSFEAIASKGYIRDLSNIADVSLICSEIKCCSKNSLIFEFDAEKEGYYQGILFDQYNREVARTSIVCVKKDIDTELVYFGNENDAFGLEFDENEIFSLRLPIFLQDVFPFTYEELNQNLNGEIVRGKTNIQYRRNFVTKSISTLEHEFLLKILKCDFLQINNINYQFQGEYNIPEHRTGALDMRSAQGLLVKRDSVDSNLKNCLSLCN